MTGAFFSVGEAQFLAVSFYLVVFTVFYRSCDASSLVFGSRQDTHIRLDYRFLFGECYLFCLKIGIKRSGQRQDKCVSFLLSKGLTKVRQRLKHESSLVSFKGNKSY